MNPLPPRAELDRAVETRDASYDGVFFTAVRTTGIFCRPSCPARTPLRQNREYYPTAQAALAAGYRPCMRCRPLETNGQPPAWVQHLLGVIDREPAARLGDVQLRTLGIDPARVRRYFRKHYGMTFHAYCRGRRMGEALQQIRQGNDLDDVALGSGYDSHSGFREAFLKTFGQPPGRSRSADCLVIDWIESPIGPLLLAAVEQGVCLLEFGEPERLNRQLLTLRRHFGCAAVPGRHRHLDQLKRELGEYFAGQRTEFQVPLVYPGTPFQVKVWDALRRIPYGQTCSYEALGRTVGCPSAQRAVGLANGKNRLAVVIPCHRVVNKDGRLGGYGGGLWRKEHLLALERKVANR
jgi:AraC family transcriptional regulator of adaptative response/methylated-DNA-[protein]-cysteine methyltransferase